MDDDGRDINPDRPEDAEAPEEEGASTASIAIDEDPAATPAWQNQQSRYATSVKRWSEPNVSPHLSAARLASSSLLHHVSDRNAVEEREGGDSERAGRI
jgi:hypothetical protein